nr:zf-CCHC domain-containing protein/UBN2 domain-containing protein [Tanacetum cinerariifolium]GEY36561.1 zf-CCHC domain-containing protein/UBN2 domain-containing protein [Tanacetum cinerariifolium]
MVIEESKDLSLLALDELIDNLKVHEVVMEKDFEIYKGKKERVKSIALKAKKKSIDDETLTSGNDDEEYDMVVRNFKKFFRRKGKFVRQSRKKKKSFRQRDDNKGKSDRKCFRCGDPNHLIGESPKPLQNKDQKAFVGDVDIGCKSCQQIRFENTRLKENQVKFVKFDKSANPLREMLNVQKSPSCKIGLGFDKSNVSTSETKPMSFVGSTVELAEDQSTLKADGSTIPGSVDSSTSQKVAEHVFSPHMSSQSDFVSVIKKLIRNSIEYSKRPTLKPSLKNGLDYFKTESGSKTPPPRRNNYSQQRHNTPQPRRNSSETTYQSHYPMSWNNNQNQ